MNSTERNIHISYRFFPTKDLTLQTSFREYLHQQVPTYTERLLEWHDQLCRIMVTRIDDWWYTNGSRLKAWLPAIYQPYYFAEALKSFRLKEGFSHIHLSEAPRELKEYLDEIDKDGHYTYTFNDPVKSSFKIRLKTFFAPAFEFLKLTASLFRSPKRFEKNEYDLIIYSHFFGIQRWLSSGDHFYGKMFSQLSERKRILWVYYPSVRTSNEDVIKVSEGLKNSDVDFLFWHLEGFSQYFTILKRCLRFKLQSQEARPHLPDLSYGDVPCRRFVNRHFNQMVAHALPLSEIKVETYFQNLFKKISAKKLIHPFEDKGLERAIHIVSAKKNIQTIGYAHAVHNDGHLYFKKNKSRMLMPPRPVKVFTTGKAASEWIIRKSENSIPVEVLGSNRYREALSPRISDSEFRLLVLIGQAHELTMLANWADQEPELLSDCQIIVRPYPYSDHEEQESAISRLNSHYKVEKNNLSLEKQIESSDLVLFSSTSAGFEAMLMGRLTVYANLHDIVPLSPLKDKASGSDAIGSAENGSELKRMIQEIQKMGPEERRNQAMLQREFAVQIYSRPDLSVID